MTDEELLQQSANVPTMYFDGFGGYRKTNGVFRCIGYILGSGAQLNLVVSIGGADLAAIETRRTLDEAPTKCINIWGGAAMAH
jgi:hypothetical protein